MIGVYFSGTGNSKYCVEKFLQEYDAQAMTFSIEDNELLNQIDRHTDIAFGYPVQYSNIPKILKDFIVNHSAMWKDKRVFIIATMGLFSGDGSGILARELKRHGAVVIGGLHLKMPDSIGDEKVLKRSIENNKKLIIAAEKKIKKAVIEIKNGNSPQEGIGILYHIAGLMGQRLYFINKTKQYSNRLKINSEKCIGCNKCVRLCPMKNIEMKNQIAVSGNSCTLCYRCVNNCPKQAITLLGKRVIEQSIIDKYL